MAIPRGHRFPIEFDGAFPQGLVLIGDDDVHGTPVREISKRDGPSIVLVGRTDGLRHIDPTGDAAIDVHA